MLTDYSVLKFKMKYTSTDSKKVADILCTLRKNREWTIEITQLKGEGDLTLIEKAEAINDLFLNDNVSTVFYEDYGKAMSLTRRGSMEEMVLQIASKI